MTVPILTVDAAFGSNPGASSFTWTNIHTDPSAGIARVRDLTYQRGRSNELNQMQTGTATCVLGDAASDFDPSNPSGRFSANVRPYVPLRAQATIGGTTYPLFQHFVYSWPRTTRVAMTWTERTIGTVDGFEWLADAGLANASYSSEATGTRVANVLNTVGWSSTLRTLGTGNATMQAATFAASDNMKALTHLLQAQQDENGLFYIDGTGKIVFVQRQDLIKSPYTVSQATFHDGVASGAGYPFYDIVPSLDLDTTFNSWAGTRSGGATQTTNGAASQAAYGLRTQQFSSLVTNDVDVLAQTQWKLYQFGNPLNRIASVTLKPGVDTGFWQKVLPLELGQRITLREQPPGFAAPTQTDYTIQSINVHFPQGTAADATFTYGLWPAITTSFWILNTSKLNSTTVVAY